MYILNQWMANGYIYIYIYIYSWVFYNNINIYIYIYRAFKMLLHEHK